MHADERSVPRAAGSHLASHRLQRETKPLFVSGCSVHLLAKRTWPLDKKDEGRVSKKMHLFVFKTCYDVLKKLGVTDKEVPVPVTMVSVPPHKSITRAEPIIRSVVY